ncbi:MAG: AraC family transcriptional regulator [Ruminococcaceae bacterium]|nr:AraC family transcriptional regulator [Oscillospiraceae bacterium]
MKKIFWSNHFLFNEYTHTKYRYTNNTKGSPLHYLAYMLKGNAKITTSDKTLIINEGDVFYIPKDLSYQSFWYGDDNDVIKFLSFGFLDLNIKEASKYELQIIDCDEDLKERVKNIPTFKDNADCKSLSIFYDVMSDIIPFLTRNTKNSEGILLDKIKHAIYSNPHMSFFDIASLCKISEPYLYKIFKTSNMTPNEYRQIRLCEISIELLCTTDKKIEEICNILHFSSASYFRKILKKYTGCTPSEIRKRGSI